MKIFYAVQATGNGHISRAMELLPYLQRYGTVDIFLSGANSSLQIDAPVQYRSDGLSLFYNCSGGLDYWKIVRGLHPLHLKKEIRDLPVEKYDLVINDFEYITSAACARKKIPSIQMGHQASFQSTNTPRPTVKNSIGEWLLKNYAKASHYIGLHFEQYDDFIFQPVVKKEIINAIPFYKDYITVYLPSYCEPELEKAFHPIKDLRFEIFSHETRQPKISGNIHFLPVNKSLFNKSLINCSSLITGGGFETPAEAIHLGKKIMSIPIRGQYEQVCNAAALQNIGITVLKKIEEDFQQTFYDWLSKPNEIQIDYSNTIPNILERLFNIYETREFVFRGTTLQEQKDFY
mgnify:CR=1 FL=1